MFQPSADSSQSSFKAEFSKIHSLPKGKRWEYIWEYYKLAFFIIAFAIFFFGMMGTFLINGLIHILNPKDPISIAFAAPGFSSSEEWMDSCLSAIGYKEKEEALQILVTKPHSDTSEDFRINTTIWLANGQPDIFIVNEAGCQHLWELEALADFRETWPEELQQLAGDRMMTSYALEISDTAFAEAYGISEEPVYLCMYLDGNGFQRALDIVEYILEKP